MVLEKGVDEGRILFLTLIAAPEGIHRICRAFPRVKVRAWSCPTYGMEWITSVGHPRALQGGNLARVAKT